MVARLAAADPAARQLADEGRSELPVDVLANNGRRAGADARAAERRAGICGRLPGFHAALADGAISSGHLDAMARAAARLDDAKAMTVDEFATACRDKAREVTDDDGVAAQDRLPGNGPCPDASTPTPGWRSPASPSTR